MFDRPTGWVGGMAAFRNERLPGPDWLPPKDYIKAIHHEVWAEGAQKYPTVVLGNYPKLLDWLRVRGHSGTAFASCSCFGFWLAEELEESDIEKMLKSDDEVYVGFAKMVLKWQAMQ